MFFRVNKWFVLVAGLLFFIGAAFVYYSCHSYLNKINEQIAEEIQGSRRSFDVGVRAVSENMRQIATYIASEQDIQLLFYGGVQAVNAVGTGSAEAEGFREELYDRIVDSWAELKSRYDIRQLQFFAGKGAFSFLRVHKPAKFGDDISAERHMIVDANSSLTPQGGFEIGRSDIGIRGVIPVFFDTGNGKYVHMGALEAGTSFNVLLKTLSLSKSVDYAVYISYDKLRSIMWPNQLETKLGLFSDVGGYLVDSFTDDSLVQMVQDSGGLPYFSQESRPVVYEESGKYFYTGSFPIFDYVSLRDNINTPTGYVVVRKDITAMMQQYDSYVFKTVIMGIAGYLLMLLVLAASWRLATGKLLDVIDERTKQLKEAKNEAERLSRVKSDFLANMSHEIRTPMNCILGFADILSKRSTDKTDRKYLDNMITSGNTLLTLINDILDLSKIEAGKFSINNRAADPARIVQEIEKTFSYPAESKGLGLSAVIDSSVPKSLILDDIRFRQILLNLTGNAVKYTDNGFVKLHLWAEPQAEGASHTELVFSVSDSGIGISEEMQEKIFEAFEQHTRPDMAKYGGTGLGLAITKKLISLMNGRITVKSSLGQGTVMTVRFSDVPVAATLESDGGYVRTCYCFRPANILIVDDIELNRELLGEYLKGFDFTLRFAENGDDGVRIMETFRPDLVLVDMRMPVMTGYDMIVKMKNNEKLADVPVIAISASSIKETVEQIRQVCSSYLHKPVSRDQLLGEMAKYLGGTVSRESDIPPETDCAGAELFEKIKDRAALAELFEKDIMPRWNNLKDVLSFEEVTAFAADVRAAGKEYSADALCLWADRVEGHISMFEMDELATVFVRLEEINHIIKKA